jgi:hypothetical protein
VDFLCVDGDCAAALAKDGARDVASVSHVGISVDAADFFGGGDCADGELVDGAASAVVIGAAWDSGGDSVLLLLAQERAARHPR